MMRNNQNGFRPGRWTIAHILAIKRLIEGIKTRNIQSIIMFVDSKIRQHYQRSSIQNFQDLWNTRNTNKSYTISSHQIKIKQVITRDGSPFQILCYIISNRPYFRNRSGFDNIYLVIYIALVYTGYAAIIYHLLPIF